MVKYGIYDYLQAMPIHSPSGCFMDGWRRIIKREKTSLCEQAPFRQAMPHSHPFGALHGRLAPYKTAKINAPASKLAERYFYCFAWLVA